MINQDQLIKGILEFINMHKRLPYIAEDDIDVPITNDEGELELRPYRALKYVKEIFANQEKCTQYLLDNKLITYEMISEIIKIDRDRLENLLSKKISEPEIKERRQIEVFFNRDYFEELGKWNDMCTKCSKKCQQFYWVNLISCNKFKEKKSKK